MKLAGTSHLCRPSPVAEIGLGAVNGRGYEQEVHVYAEPPERWFCAKPD